MDHPQLSILIPTIAERKPQFDQLLEKLKHQSSDKPVEILWNSDNREKPTGTKRNELIDEANGAYICFVDDDDQISDDYIDSILEGAQSDSDVITFRVRYQSRRNCFLVYYSKEFEEDAIPIFTGADGVRYTNRLPNHLMPVKRNFAVQARFPEVYWREDAHYAKRLKPLLKTEFEIPRVLYHYIYTK